MTDEKVMEMTNKILDLLDKAEVHDLNDVRRIAGLVLSSTHMAMVASGETNKDKIANVMACADSIHRLLMSLKKSISDFGVQGIVLDFGYDI